jgi:hypothetical protein
MAGLDSIELDESDVEELGPGLDAIDTACKFCSGVEDMALLLMLESCSAPDMGTEYPEVEDSSFIQICKF